MTPINRTYIADGNELTIFETSLTDGSCVYDVALDGSIIYHAFDEKDAGRFVEGIKALYIPPTKAILEKLPLHRQLSALSYRFPFNSYEAKALSEAALLLERK